MAFAFLIWMFPAKNLRITPKTLWTAPWKAGRRSLGLVLKRSAHDSSFLAGGVTVSMYSGDLDRTGLVKWCVTQSGRALTKVFLKNSGLYDSWSLKIFAMPRG